MEDEGPVRREDGREVRDKEKLTKKETKIISKEFDAQKVKYSIPNQQQGEDAKSKESTKDKTPDMARETAKVDLETGKASG